MFGAELASKEPSKALYALANASCFQSGTSRSFPFSRTMLGAWKDGKERCDERRREGEARGKSIFLLFVLFVALSRRLFAFRCRFLFSLRLMHTKGKSRFCFLSFHVFRLFSLRLSFWMPRTIVDASRLYGDWENRRKFLCRYPIMRSTRVHSRVSVDRTRKQYSNLKFTK